MRFRLINTHTIGEHRTIVGLAILGLALLIACTSATATPAPTVTPTPTIVPTPTVEPTATLAPTATVDPTDTGGSTPLDLKPALSSVNTFAVLEKFLDELGSRESATEQESAAARYLQSRFRELGYATELQAFSVEDLSLAGMGLTLETPQPGEFAASPMVNSGLGEVSGVLTPVGLAMPGDIPDGGLEGRIALAKRGVIRFQGKAENVFAAGAVGLVVYNNVEGSFRGVLATQPEFPVISISRDDGEAIEAILAESGTKSEREPGTENGKEAGIESGIGAEIEASIALTLEDRPSANVIAEKKGPGDAVVVLGGHYDSVPGILGANDNASGAAVLLAIAESLAEVDLPFTLRIVPFGSEELGLLGSEFYVGSLSEEELNRTKFMLNFDALGSGTGVRVFGDGDLTTLALAIGDGMGVDVAVRQGMTGGSSDFASFQAAGVPFMMFFGDDFSRIHTESDTIEFIEPELLDAATAIATALLQSEAFRDLITTE